jgi:membrane peptidoglycan carboxypeptidase
LAPGALSWPQAALLAGLTQAPSSEDPLAHPAMARAMEGQVLGRLVATGTLTRTQADRASQQPLHLTARRDTKCAATSSQATG